MVTVEEVVDSIPAVLVQPDHARGGVVLWMSHLGGSAAQTLPMLERFAAAGRPAVSFDATGHGKRGSGDAWEFASGVLASFRRRMWPILGQTTLEAMRVVTWALERTANAGAVGAGGVSMGGDVAVALAGIDSRVRRVATVGSTPNWARPGMRELRDESTLVDQGTADPYSQWFADHLDPMRHLARFHDGADIAFELGGDDKHIPQENAETFVETLLGQHTSSHLRVQVHPGLDHLGVTSSEVAMDAAAAWLLAH